MAHGGRAEPLQGTLGEVTRKCASERVRNSARSWRGRGVCVSKSERGNFGDHHSFIPQRATRHYEQMHGTFCLQSEVYSPHAPHSRRARPACCCLLVVLLTGFAPSPPCLRYSIHLPHAGRTSSPSFCPKTRLAVAHQLLLLLPSSSSWSPVNELENLTMARPMAPIHSSLCCSVSAYM